MPDELFRVGHAPDDGVRGWFVGQFVEGGGLRSRRDVELKWGIHPAGDHRAKGWAAARTATTACILIEGRFVVQFRVEGEVRYARLERPGDYVIYGPGTPHSWEAPEAAIVLTVRFPSVAGDELTFPD